MTTETEGQILENAVEFILKLEKVSMNQKIPAKKQIVLLKIF